MQPSGKEAGDCMGVGVIQGVGGRATNKQKRRAARNRKQKSMLNARQQAE